METMCLRMDVYLRNGMVAIRFAVEKISILLFFLCSAVPSFNSIVP